MMDEDRFFIVIEQAREQLCVTCDVDEFEGTMRALGFSMREIKAEIEELLS